MTPAPAVEDGPGSTSSQLAAARQEVLGRIATACVRAGRDPAGVRLLAVSKGVPVEKLRLAGQIGLLDFGENRVQEAASKVAALPDARWHLIGRLQSNKAGRAVDLFHTVQSVDSLQLAGRLARLAETAGRRLPVYLQVNVDGDPAKSGFEPGQLAQGLAQVADLERLELRGLMTIGRAVERPADARRTFAALRELGAGLRAAEPRLGAELSMGMSDDYEMAVEEGATVVRIGRALFGERPAP
ncbi:MAG TPA: YggS family pyridoxal phosphate-dependent enzyme [Candidatus Limnocylindrales bacterium]|nr:YggS family pyridoxal phosphate-dependent enzyme [Candidatus Limnocylindrales bacterium]